jgi:hypothetical protein
MSKLFDDASLAMIPSAYKDGRLYSIRPIPEYGSEVLSQPVDIDTDFIANSGGVIVDANTFTTAGGSTDGIIKNGLIQSNKRYRLEIQGTTTSSGFTIGNGQASGNEYGTGFGVHYFTSASTNLWIRQNTAGTTDITTFSIKEVLVNGDFTFSRGSNLAATRVDVNGLIKKGRENLITYSNDFTQWVQANVDVTINAVQNPFNNGTTQTIAERVGTSTQYRIYTNSYTTSSGTMYSHSVYVKRLSGTRDFAIIDVSGGARVYFNMTTISVGSEEIGKGKIEDVGNGWYRLSVYGLATGNSSFFLAMANGATTGSETYTSDGSGSFAIYAAQLEQGLVATDYIETGASTAKAGILENMPRLDYSGGASCPSLLLEPQRTNLVEYSEYFQEWHTNSNVSFSTNEATSPEGLTNATKLTATSTSNSYVRDNLNAPAGNNVFSVFAKYEDCQYISLRSNFYTGGDEFEVWFDIQNGVKGGSTGDNVTYNIEDYGNDWYRCYAVFNIDAGDTSGYCYVYLSSTDESFNVVNGTGALLYGGQLEAGSYPTSYIPTYGTSQTRSVEQLYTLEDSSLFDLEQGTFFLEMSALEDDGTDRKISISDGTNNNMVNIGFSRFTGNINGEVISNGVLQTSGFAATGVTQTNNNKFALVWGNGEFRFYVNGVKTKELSISNSPVGMDILRFAQGNDSQRPFLNNKQLLVFPTALTDSECIALTTL